MCKTRWVARHDALEVFGDLYLPVVDSLQDIVDGTGSWSPDSTAKAKALLLAITQFEFLMAFVVCRNGLRFVQPLSVGLQGRSNDICSAMAELDHVVSAIQDCRTNIDSLGTECHDQACSIGRSVDAPQPSMPRIGRRQKHRANTSASTPKEYYHRTVTVPFIDHLLSELSNRFDQSKDKAACGLALIPSIMAADPESSTKILQYAELVQKDLPCPTHVSSEIQCWRKKWRILDQQP